MNAIAISVSEENWPGAMESVTSSGSVCGLVAPVNLLMNSADFHSAVANGGVNLPHAIRPMGGNAERYLYESGGGKRNRILGHWVRVLSPLGAMGVGSVAVDLGLDRIRQADVESAIGLRIEILKHILSCLESPLTLTVRVRCPPDFPGSRSWERAAQIVHGVMDAGCRLQLDVFPGEIELIEEWQKFERSFHLYAAVLNLHIDPSAEESLAESGALDLCAGLRRRGFRGLTYFTLVGACQTAKNYRTLCRDIANSFFADADHSFSQPIV
ncbi:MAG: hypothetical protein ACOCUY_00370 [Verrucomicrobiota bacterium]